MISANKSKKKKKKMSGQNLQNPVTSKDPMLSCRSPMNLFLGMVYWVFAMRHLDKPHLLT